MEIATDLLDRFDAGIGELGWIALPVLSGHAISGARLPGRHKDPFDRLLAGQAIVVGLTVATVDPAFAAFGAAVVW